MKKPLNYAILKYVTKVEKASAQEIVDALKGEYGTHRMLKKSAVLDSLMTAEKNGLLEEAGYELDSQGELVIYFSAPEECAAAINSYIKD